MILEDSVFVPCVVFSHWLISVEDVEREDKIEIRSVLEQIIPVVGCLLALVVLQVLGGGSSDARRLLELGIGAKVVPTKSE